MALILGLFIFFCFGLGVGVWATYDWFRFKSLSDSAKQTELLNSHVLSQLADQARYSSTGSEQAVDLPSEIIFSTEEGNDDS